MIAPDDLIALVRNYNPKTNDTLIRAAYDYGQEMHVGSFVTQVSRISAIQLRSRPF